MSLIGPRYMNWTTLNVAADFYVNFISTCVLYGNIYFLVFNYSKWIVNIRVNLLSFLDNNNTSKNFCDFAIFLNLRDQIRFILCETLCIIILLYSSPAGRTSVHIIIIMHNSRDNVCRTFDGRKPRPEYSKD